MTMLYLGTTGDKEQVSALVAAAEIDSRPGGLVSFWYLPIIKMNKALEDWCRGKRFLDSGAFTAQTKKKPIDIDALIEEVNSGRWAEAAALDVIGDPEKSARNAEYMATKCPGIIPVFHFGEPWEFLQEYARKYEKVGLGGIVPVKSVRDREAWLDECFSRIWPKKTHLFGCISRKVLMKYPVHSADSTGWCSSQMYGTFNMMGGAKLGLNRPKMRAAVGKNYLLPEIAIFRRLQIELEARWRGEFKKQGWIKEAA